MEHVACLARDGFFFCKTKTHAVLEQEFAPVFNFTGLLLLLLRGTSGEAEVHVVARLSPRVFTVARPSHGRYGHRQFTNTTHGWLPWLRHRPAGHQQTSFDVADPETLALTQRDEATLALVHVLHVLRVTRATCSFGSYSVPKLFNSTLSEKKTELTCVAA